MKLRFKVQDYQTNAVDAVVDCFGGQPKSVGLRYRIDPGRVDQTRLEIEGFKNDEIRLTDGQLLANIQAVQKRQNLPLSKSLEDFSEVDRTGKSKPKPRTYKPGAKLNLDVEMETGTGKTYCYIKT